MLKDDKHVDDKLIQDRVDQLQDAHKAAPKKIDKDFIMSRIASLTGGVGVINVGGNTDLEQKELYDRVDDAVCAVRSALVEGILPGGGVALLDADHEMGKSKFKAEFSKLIAGAILSSALKAPSLQILINAGIENTKVSSDDKRGFGLDVKTGKTGDMISMGIIDPVKVTKVALQNAVSVAVTILSTNAIVTMARTYEAK
jgi:chaperonin GroEL